MKVEAAGPGPEIAVEFRSVTRRLAPRGRPQGTSLISRWMDSRRTGRDLEGEEDDDEPELEEDGAESVEQSREVALQDVSFEVARGSALGLIGPDDVAKTTIIRIVSGLVPSTHGEVVVHGRVLPVTGELVRLIGVGKDAKRILHLGSLVGIPRRHLRNRVEDILAFADLRSLGGGDPSWASRRLALATVLHGDAPVLAVGAGYAGADEVFRQRCLARLMQLRDEGCTILIAGRDAAGRDIDGTRRINDEVLWLEQGAVADRGSFESVIGRRGHAHTTAGADSEGDESHRLQLDDLARALADHLELAHGDKAVRRATREAAEAAAAANESAVGWVRLADAAKLDLVNAQSIVQRLTARAARPRQEAQEEFGSQAALLVARTVRADGRPGRIFETTEELTLELWLELFEPEAKVTATIDLMREDEAPVRVGQPVSLPAEAPGTYRLFATVPGGLLSEGAYHGRAHVEVEFVGGLLRLGRTVRPFAVTSADDASDEVLDGVPVEVESRELAIEPATSATVEWRLEQTA